MKIGMVKNGGGVPVNSEKEFADIKSAAGGMLKVLFRNKNISNYSEMLEDAEPLHGTSYFGGSIGPMKVHFII